MSVVYFYFRVRFLNSGSWVRCKLKRYENWELILTELSRLCMTEVDGVVGFVI